MDIIKSKNAREASREASKKTPGLWVLFQNQLKTLEKKKQRNRRFVIALDKLIKRVDVELKQQEQAFASSLFALTEKLLAFCERKSLLQWQKEELLFWISENTITLASNPFADHLPMQELSEKLMRVQEQFSGRPEPSHGCDQHYDELAGDSQEDESDGGLQDEELDDLFEEFFSDQGTHDEGAEEPLGDTAEDNISAWIKRSSVNQLFRKVARVLHPDRHVDVVEKAEKHRLMSELSQARDQNDFATILNFYARYVDPSLDTLPEDELEKMVEVLRHQCRELDFEKENVAYQTPFHAAVYEHFYASSAKRTNAKFEARIQLLREEEQLNHQLTAELKNLKVLKSVLADRQAYDAMAQMEEFGFDLDDLFNR